MKLIVAGGRSYRLSLRDQIELGRICRDLGVTEIVTGGSAGVDYDADFWAKKHGYPTTVFWPKWNALGRRAGPIRNREMAAYAAPNGACLLFTGGRGTANMRHNAESYGLRIILAGQQ